MDFRFSNAPAIVANFHHHIPHRLAQRYFDFRGVGMADDVGQSFLENAKQRRVEVLVPERVAKPGFDTATYSRSLFKLAGLPLDCRWQPGSIQDARPQLRRDAADCLDRLVDMPGHPAGLFMEQFQVLGQPIDHPHELQFQRGQGLAQLVVNLPGDPRALLLADELQVG